ncbi:MAG: CoA-binding protein [Deltaproteobacteria bacterium]|nr:CoA-binding protein [Deltaproteobacteria bacterium]MBW1914344.1 CoA-binding protein [Deltaproteobacteria bacterium]
MTSDGIMSDKTIKEVLENTDKVAVVGLSPKPDRDSNRVARYLMDKGYSIVPVNPGQKEILDERCYRSLEEIPFHVDLVNIFLNPVRIPPIVDQAIKIGAKVIWMQLGVIHEESAERAKSAGLQVIMDRCIKVEHASLFNPVHNPVIP